MNQPNTAGYGLLSAPNGINSAKIAVPGSKSFSNRCLLLAALSKGETTVEGILISKDTRIMSAALREMGVTVGELRASSVSVGGTGVLSSPAAALHVGNAGTAARFLTAACCLVGGEVVIDGDDDMRKRPISPLLDALNAIGFSCQSTTGCLPASVSGDVEKIQRDSLFV